MAKDVAALSIDRKKERELLPGSGLNMTPTSSRPGASSFRKDNHLLPNDGSNGVSPVTLPPGRDKLVTYPIPTGSLTLTKTIGIVVDARCSAAIDVFDIATMTAGRMLINSLAKV
jgi:hypothetical protein